MERFFCFYNSAALWTSSTICGGLLFPQADRAVADVLKNIRGIFIDFLSSYALKSTIHAIGIKNIPVFPIHEMRAEEVETDILFLDIELECPGQDMGGMEMARQIRGMEVTKQPIIIFVTGYEKYVYDAFDVGTFQYLLKPVDEQKFAEVFRRAAEQAAADAEQDKKALMIQYGSTGKTIPLHDIYYLESQNHKIAVHTKGGVFEYYAKMSDLEKELQGQFCRVHKGYLINLSHVDEYNRTEVVLANGAKLLISKYKYEDFVKAYLRFMQ